MRLGRRPAPDQATHTDFTLQNSWSPSWSSSRPIPELLIPPKGSWGIDTTMPLTKTCPASQLGDEPLLLVGVVGPHARAQPELGVVGQGQGLVGVGRRVEQGHRPEHLLGGHPHGRGDAGDDRGTVEEARVVGAAGPDHPLAAAQDGGPVAAGVLHLGGDGVAGRRGDQRTDLGGRVEGVAHRERVHAGDEPAR